MYLSLCTMYSTFFFMKDTSPGLQWTKNRQVCWAKPSRKIGCLDILIFGRLSHRFWIECIKYHHKNQIQVVFENFGNVYVMVSENNPHKNWVGCNPQPLNPKQAPRPFFDCSIYGSVFWGVAFFYWGRNLNNPKNSNTSTTPELPGCSLVPPPFDHFHGPGDFFASGVYDEGLKVFTSCHHAWKQRSKQVVVELTKPFEKICGSQIGSFPQKNRDEILKIFELPPPGSI